MDKMLLWTLRLGQNVTVDVVNLDVTSGQPSKWLRDFCLWNQISRKSRHDCRNGSNGSHPGKRGFTESSWFTSSLLRTIFLLGTTFPTIYQILWRVSYEGRANEGRVKYWKSVFQPHVKR